MEFLFAVCTIALLFACYVLWEIRGILLKTYEETERLSSNFYDYYGDILKEKRVDVD